MRIYSKEQDEAVKKHLIGMPSLDSIEEQTLCSDIRGVLYQNPDTPYVFMFNQPLYVFNVPTKSYKMSEYQNEFLEYMVMQCRIDRQTAIELYEIADKTPVRTNALKVDAAKVKDGKLEIALELNSSTHYDIPDDFTVCADFARRMFCDMIKRKVLSSMTNFVPIDFSQRRDGTMSTKEHLRTAKLLYDFVHNV